MTSGAVTAGGRARVLFRSMPVQLKVIALVEGASSHELSKPMGLILPKELCSSDGYIGVLPGGRTQHQ